VTPYLEIGGDYREVLPGVHLIELPLPFSLGLVNVYLVRLADGWMLIDCGMETEACFRALDRAREGLGVAWTDIRQILLTHIHIDHMGLARKLLGLTGARLYLHVAEARLLGEIAESGRYEAWHRNVLLAAGVSQATIIAVESSMFVMRDSFRRLDPDVPLSGGETLETTHGPLEVIWTPGHSPGLVCLYDGARRALFSSDHILEHISPNIGWQPDHDALGEFLSSLDRIGQLEVDLILPSHGAPFTGHRAWVRQTREHHTERCNRILALLEGGARTAHDLTGGLWDRPLSPLHYRFAIFEVLAHLEHLSRLGRVSAADQEGITQWRRG
jgi:glyoxylase-like metal-dependent hydrolase (beta-lactamase superfamily II)